MSVISSRRLSQPTCVFANGNELSGPDERLKGLRTYGPYDNSKVPQEPRVLFVFPTQYRNHANELYAGLKNGSSQFSGLSAMFGMSIRRESVLQAPAFELEPGNNAVNAQKYRESIELALAESRPVDFAIVLCPRTSPDESISPYYSAKLALAASGIASQVVTTDLLESKAQLTWSLANIALQMFVKLGGQPWYVKPSVGAGDIVVGIGRSERTDARGRTTRVVGFTTAYSSGGVFKSVEVFQPERSFADYLGSLEESVANALGRLIADDLTTLRLVLHVPSRFSKKEEAALKRALGSIGGRLGGYTVLRVVEDHPFEIFDLAHATAAPLSGLDIELDARNHLVQLEGRPETGNMRRSPPRPLWVTLQTTSFGEATLEGLVQQIYDLSVANWRGFNAKAKPITTHYSKLVASILSSGEGDDIMKAISANAALRAVPWFV